MKAKEMMKSMFGDNIVAIYDDVIEKQMRFFSKFLETNFDLFSTASSYEGIHKDDLPALKLIIMNKFKEIISGDCDYA